MEQSSTENKVSGQASWRTALFLFLRISGWIAFPVVLALFIGRALDEKYGTHPLYFLLTTGVAFIVSMIGIVRESRKTIKSMSKVVEDKK